MNTGIRNSFLLFLCLVGTSGSLDACAKSRPKTSPSPRQESTIFKLAQWNAISADWQVFIGKSGIRGENTKSHTIVIARAPAWQIAYYNSQTKRYWIDAKEKFFLNDLSQGFLISMHLPSIMRVPLKATGTTKTLNGLRCQCFSSDANYTAAQKALFRRGEISPRHPQRVTLFATGDIPASKEATFVLSRIFGVPDKHLVPIEARYYKLTEKDQAVLTTTSVTRVPPPANWLELPAGSTRVKDIQTVRIDETSKHGMDMMLDNIDPFHK